MSVMFRLIHITTKYEIIRIIKLILFCIMTVVNTKIQLSLSLKHLLSICSFRDNILRFKRLMNNTLKI